MMADIQATLGLDRSEFRSGLRAAEREGGDWARTMEKTFGSIQSGLNFGKLALTGGLLAKAFHEGMDAIREFAKSNDEARAQVEKWDQTVGVLKSSVGAVLLPLLQDVSEAFDAITGGAGSAKIADQVSAASMAKLQAETKAKRDADAAAAADEAARAADNGKFQRGVQAGNDALYINSLRQNGSDREADILTATATYRRQLEELKYDKSLTPNQLATRRGLLESQIANFGQDAGRAYDMRTGKAASEAGRQADFDEQSRAIELMRMRGEDPAARSAEIDLAMRQQWASVYSNPALSEDRKSSLFQSISATRDAMLTTAAGNEVAAAEEAVRQASGPAATRGLYAGLNSASAAHAVFGGGGAYMAPASDPMLRAQERLEKAQKEQTRVLEAIRDNTARSSVAIAG